MIIFKHTETNQSHVYELKNRWAYIVALLALLFPLVLMLTIGGTTSNNFLNILIIVLWVAVWGGLIIDVVPMYLKQTVAAIQGKTIITSGSLFTKENHKVEVRK
ncbi:MAG: hypothetical protein Q7K44_01630 [Candidatus Liptonbacteria bacterium]|nr:hypothetical protein [Candidatus Liptonbacteria bacterium]